MADTDCRYHIALDIIYKIFFRKILYFSLYSYDINKSMSCGTESHAVYTLESLKVPLSTTIIYLRLAKFLLRRSLQFLSFFFFASFSLPLFLPYFLQTLLLHHCFITFIFILRRLCLA